MNITIQVGEFTWLPPLKYFIDALDHHIAVTNEKNTCQTKKDIMVTFSLGNILVCMNITIQVGEFTWFPPLKYFIDALDHPIAVTNEKNTCQK